VVKLTNYNNNNNKNNIVLFGKLNANLFSKVSRVVFQYPRQRFSDGGIEVSMVAFQAVDPGSIPGHRKIEILIQFGLVFLRQKAIEPTRDRTWNLLLSITH
jgi:hypothetical protein